MLWAETQRRIILRVCVSGYAGSHTVHVHETGHTFADISATNGSPSAPAASAGDNLGTDECAGL